MDDEKKATRRWGMCPVGREASRTHHGGDQSTWVQSAAPSSGTPRVGGLPIDARVRDAYIWCCRRRSCCCRRWDEDLIDALFRSC